MLSSIVFSMASGSSVSDNELKNSMVFAKSFNVFAIFLLKNDKSFSFINSRNDFSPFASSSFTIVVFPMPL